MKEQGEKKMTRHSLFVLRGGEGSLGFWEDVEVLNSLDPATQVELIEKTFKWFGVKDIEKEWDEWLKGVDDKEKTRRKSAIRVLLYLSKENLSRRIPNERIESDLKAIGLSDHTVEKYIELQKQYEKDFVAALSARFNKTFASMVSTVNWRVDRILTTPYETDMADLVLFLRIGYETQNDETLWEVFEFREPGLESFIETLNQALDALKKGKEC
jgi:hypothetical protein